MAILKKGLSGEPVRRLQAKLGIEADGEFGPDTEKALKDWQTKNGLSADGIAGPDTFMAMGLYELVLLKQGTRGDAVKKLQEKLAIGADGQFGSATEKAVRDYQQVTGRSVRYYQVQRRVDGGHWAWADTYQRTRSVRIWWANWATNELRVRMIDTRGRAGAWSRWVPYAP